MTNIIVLTGECEKKGISQSRVARETYFIRPDKFV